MNKRGLIDGVFTHWILGYRFTLPCLIVGGDILHQTLAISPAPTIRHERVVLERDSEEFENKELSLLLLVFCRLSPILTHFSRYGKCYRRNKIFIFAIGYYIKNVEENCCFAKGKGNVVVCVQNRKICFPVTETTGSVLRTVVEGGGLISEI